MPRAYSSRRTLIDHVVHGAVVTPVVATSVVLIELLIPALVAIGLLIVAAASARQELLAFLNKVRHDS